MPPMQSSRSPARLHSRRAWVRQQCDARPGSDGTTSKPMWMSASVYWPPKTARLFLAKSGSSRAAI